jgi:excisionase family DNA binding protein
MRPGGGSWINVRIDEGKMTKPHIQLAAQHYAKFTEPLDPDKGWQREDVQVAFMAGMQDKAVRRLLTVPEVAEVLAVSPSVVRDLVRFGELAYVHAGRGTERKHLTFSIDEIESFIKRHTKRDY